MKLLHVYAGPFPSSQGTQTLIRQTCELLSDEGHEVHLLAYGTSQYTRDFNFTVHRIPNWPRHNGFRAGPSLQKPFLDLWLSLATSRLIKKLGPDVVCPHHVEAFLSAYAPTRRAGISLAYHLHALFEPELHTYFPRRLAKWAGLAGHVFDCMLPPRADATIALSKAQQNALPKCVIDKSKLNVVRPPFDADDMLHMPTDEPDDDAPCVGCYIGNLDDYQNIQALLEGFTLLSPNTKEKMRFQIITDSEPKSLTQHIEKLGLHSLVSVHPHGEYKNARARLAASDFTVIPRTAPGGVPIKLVNALALKVSVMLDPKLAEDLEPEEALVVDMSNPSAIAKGIDQLVNDPGKRATLSIRAESAARRLFDPEKYVAQLTEVYRSIQ